MKKRIVILTGVLAASLWLAGCAGSNTASQKSEEKAGQGTTASAGNSAESVTESSEKAASGSETAPQTTSASEKAAQGQTDTQSGSGEGSTAGGNSSASGQSASSTADDLVNMVKNVSTETNEKILGEQTGKEDIAGKESLVIINQTGDAIAAVYIRPNTDSGGNDWGSDLIGGRFILADNDKARYYFDADGTDYYGNKITEYDIRITYEETGRNECFFRKLPFNEIKEIYLCMEGKGQDAIPYARYINKTTSSEHSTLEEVKERLGLSGSSSMDNDDSGTSAQTAETEQNTQEQQTGTTEPDNIDTFDETPDPGATQAQSYIGMSLDQLESMMGSPDSSEYTEEPETGRTGYHYYNTFTVSTTVDDDGNEIVAGIW